jgi:hypothetical protein
MHVCRCLKSFEVSCPFGECGLYRNSYDRSFFFFEIPKLGCEISVDECIIELVGFKDVVASG